MEGDSSQSTSPSKKDRDATVEAVNHLIQGKRHLLVQDYNAAVNSLQEACSLLAACYGDLANECGDAYFHYGRALLELSRKESGVFGNSKEDSGEDGEDDDDDDEDEENENDAEKEDDEEEESGEESKSSENSESKSEDLEESKKADEETITTEVVESSKTEPELNKEPEANKLPESVVKEDSLTETSATKTVSVAACSSTSDLAQPGPSGEQNIKKDEGDDVSNLQLAWEVLELAKIIFKRQAADSRELKLRLAQVYSKLGEVAMESENYDQSKEDLEECLKLQIPLLEKDDRELAETYYQLGLVYTLSHDYDSAIASFQMAISTINSRIENLNKIVATNAPPNEQGDDPVFNAKLELAELQELLPELQEKVADTIDSKKNTVKVAEELKKDFVPVAEELPPESTLSPVKEVKPITNIGHLVRKKRKPDDSPKSEDNISKKSKTTVANEENGGFATVSENNSKNGKLENNPKPINSDKSTPSDSESHVNGKIKLAGVIAETNNLPVTEG